MFNHRLFKSFFVISLIVTGLLGSVGWLLQTSPAIAAPVARETNTPAAPNNNATLTRVTTSGVGRNSYRPDISADSGTIVFSGDADLLNQGIIADHNEIWLYDTTTMTFTRATVSDNNRDSLQPSANSDGTKIAFRSDADFLNQNAPDNQFEIWLYDTAAMTVTRATNAGVSGRDSWNPSINGDGTKVAFDSDADFFGQGIALFDNEIWLYDTATMTLTRVTNTDSGGRAFAPSISADGNKIAFRSDGDFLSQANTLQEIWLYDTATMTVTRVTTGNSGRSSTDPSISGDGSKIAFVSDVDFLGEGIEWEQYEIWLYDTATMTVTRATTGAEPDGRGNSRPTINSDGTKIAFRSDVDFLSEGIPEGQDEIWLYDTVSMTLTRMTTGANGRFSKYPSINAVGDKIAFESTADFLNQGIAAGQYEVWLADNSACFVSINNSGTTDYSSADATALQTAVNAASPNDLIKIAGTCAGVQMQGGITQTVYISQNVTLQGGYTTTNWLTTPDPIMYPTVLDAEENGRVVYIASNTDAILNGLTISNGKAAGNTKGSGLFVDSSATLQLNHSTVISSTNFSKGSALSNSGITTVAHSIIAHNEGTDGGGFYNGGTLTVIETAVFDNHVDSDGGALQNFGQAIFINSTLSGNTANSNGGAIEHWGGTLWLTGTTIANNNGGKGDGIYVNQVMTATNSIFDNGSDDCRYGGGVFNDGGYNIEGTDTCGLSATSSFTNTDPLLDVLADNGGDTWTHALTAGSPAIDAGDSTYPVLADDYDQRGIGYARVVNGRLDIGAYEFLPPLVCFVSVNNSNTTDYGSWDASAVQTAVNNANPNDLIKIAGTCAGVQMQGDITQTVYISQNVTLQGGYTATSWLTAPDPIMYPTVLDAEENGRVTVVANQAAATFDALTLQNGNSSIGGGGINGGGGLLAGSNTVVTVTNSVIISNSGVLGAGIYTRSTTDLTINQSAIAGNHASSRGGGLYNQGVARISNSTLSGNSANNNGGAIAHEDTELYLVHTTIADNDGGSGNTVFIDAILIMKNSIIADNSSANCSFTIRGSIVSQGYNLDSGNSCELDQISDLINTNPLLAPLTDNGGNSKTHALQSGSPAISAGDPAYPVTVGDYDQRGVGYARVINGRLDIGAYEAPSLSVCFVSINNSNTTDYDSWDASAVQTAVTNANPNDLIKIAGTCAGVQTQNGLTQTVYIDQDLIVQGGYTNTDWLTPPDPIAHPTTLDAQNSGRVIYISGTLSTQIENLTIRGGNTAGDGGGLFSTGQTIISNSVFIYNHAYEGGAINNMGQITITASSIISNTADRTGGALINTWNPSTNAEGELFIYSTEVYTNYAARDGGALGNDGIVTLVGSTFQGNRAGRTGGVIYNSGGSGDILLDITNSTFFSNTAGETGGVLRQRKGTTTINGSTFAYNSAGTSGGALRNQGGNRAVLNINDSTFTYNTAEQHGGALENSSILSMNNVTVTHNIAQINGGGIESGDGGVLTVTNSLLRHNQANDQGGGLYAAASGTTFISNTHIISNSSVSGGGGFYASQPITISNSDIFSNTTNSYGGGGMLDGNPQFLIQNSDVSYNIDVTSEGGGLHIDGSQGTIQATQIMSNTAENSYGGGVYIYFNNTVSIVGSEIAYNYSDGGSGIYSEGDNVVTIQNTNIHHNIATNEGGGIGINNYDVLTMTQTTIAYNTSLLRGGGIGINGGAMRVINSTISHNQAVDGGGVYIYAVNGGGASNSGYITLTHSTMYSNTATQGGGVYLKDVTDGNAYIAQATLQNSIVAGNSNGDCVALNGWEVVDATAGYNLDSDGSCIAGGGTGNQTNANPGLGSLANNGGDTPTHALLPGSPAIDAGDSAYPTQADDYDQRGVGYARVANGRLDIGAYEAGAYTMTVIVSGTGGGTITSDPLGIDCGNDCSEAYTDGMVVTLTAVFPISATFTGWSGACSGNSSCVVTMDAAKSVTATFDVTQFYIFLPVILK